MSFFAVYNKTFFVLQIFLHLPVHIHISERKRRVDLSELAL